MTAVVEVSSRRTVAHASLPLLVIGHGIDDMYLGAVGALVPFFVAADNWSYAAVSGLTVAVTLVSSVAQPAFGIATDRSPKPWLVPAGMSMAGLGIGLAGLPSAYWMIWLLVAMSGLGVAAYHPESARLARQASRGSHVGMSVFSVGGNVGFALAPLFIVAVVGTLGLSATPLLAVPALACSAVTARHLLKLPDRGRSGPQSSIDGQPLHEDRRQFAVLTVVVVCRSVITFCFATFLALAVQHRMGNSEFAGELGLMTLFGFGAVGTILGGRLARRFTRVRLLQMSSVLSVPAVVGVAYAPGWFVYPTIAVTALAINLPFSLQVTLGQDYLPNHIGTASGVTLGLAVTVGGLATPVIGAIADATSLSAGLAILSLFAAAAGMISMRLREPIFATAND
jgi:FSR family fosmidomycin resistance protein-like MFS transporter